MRYGGWLIAKGLAFEDITTLIGAKNRSLPDPLPETGGNGIQHILESLQKYHDRKDLPQEEFCWVEFRGKRKQIGKVEFDQLYEVLAYREFKEKVGGIFIKVLENKNVWVYDLSCNEYMLPSAFHALHQRLLYKIPDLRAKWLHKLCSERWWDTEPLYRGIVRKALTDGPYTENAQTYWNIGPKTKEEMILRPDLAAVQTAWREIKAKNASTISTGYTNLDQSLPFGGFRKGELYMIGGLTGEGKSLVLQGVTLKSCKESSG